MNSFRIYNRPTNSFRIYNWGANNLYGFIPRHVCPPYLSGKYNIIYTNLVVYLTNYKIYLI